MKNLFVNLIKKIVKGIFPYYYIEEEKGNLSLAGGGKTSIDIIKIEDGSGTALSLWNNRRHYRAVIKRFSFKAFKFLYFVALCGKEQRKAENSLKHLIAFVGPAPHGGEKVIYHLVKGKWRWWKLDGKPHRASKRTIKKALKKGEHIKYDEFSIAAHLTAIRKELGLKEYEPIQYPKNYTGIVIDEIYEGPNLKEVWVDGHCFKNYADAWENLRTTPALIKFWDLV